MSWSKSWGKCGMHGFEEASVRPCSHVRTICLRRSLAKAEAQEPELSEVTGPNTDSQPQVKQEGTERARHPLILQTF